jgi:hypothetical protein
MGTSAAGTPLVARLLGRAGNALVTLPPVRAAGDHAQFELPISSLAAGEYLLEIRPEGAVDDSRRQLVAFRVVP